LHSSSPPRRPASSKPARILLVEDHLDSLVTLTRLLTRRGHTVTPVGTGATARTELANYTFDIIISDLGLPDCSGLELIAEMRKLHSTPAIALSGYGMDTDVLSSMAAGFNEHLTKPIDIELLLRTLDRLVSPA
jgi:CheY-like chemotaxis protein